MTTPSRPAPAVAGTRAPARIAGLDGLRAVAVALVVVYHLFPRSWMRGGFIGVDVFFVLSGFLITSLLLRERVATGRIALRTFWVRRARRLLPALVLMVTVCATLAWIVGGDVLVGLGRQVFSAATFSFNWLSLGAGSDYFTASSPELFRNLWSLAVEEQFYLVWPLLLLLFLRLRRRWTAVVVVLFLAGLSAAAMAGWAAGGQLTRAYFGTDSHAFGLLLGVGLAFLSHGYLARPTAWMRSRPARIGFPALGALALAGLVAVAGIPETAGPGTFPGTMLTAGILTAAVVVGGAWPGSPLGRALDVAPLRWVGERSYGIYLWHWPLLVVLAAAFTPGAALADVPVMLGVAALVLTLGAATASFRLVEMPVRRVGFRRLAARAGDALSGGSGNRMRALAALTASFVLLGGTTAAIAAAPPISTAQAAVDAGQDALANQSPGTPGATPTPDASPAGPVGGDQITAVGDSVMLAAAPALLEEFPGIQIDAAVSRSMYAAPGILRDLADAGQLRPYVVIGLGTNGAISASTLATIEEILGPDRQLVLVSAFAPRSWIDGVNAEIAQFARDHRGSAQVADWAAAIAPHQDLLAGDDIHPGEAGGRVFADAVADALERAQAAKAQQQQFSERRAYEQQLRADTLHDDVGAPRAE